MVYYTAPVTRKPRVTMTLSQRLLDALDAAAAKENMDRSSFVDWYLSKIFLTPEQPEKQQETPKPPRRKGQG